LSLKQLIPLLLQLSIGLVVFCLGLRANTGDLTYLLRRPSLLLRSLLAMLVVVPLVAVGAAAGLHLKPELETALILLAVSPVPPILPGKEAKAGGNVSYAVGLLAWSATIAIVSAPFSVECIARLFGVDVHVPMAVVAKIIAISVLGPLVLGFAVKRMAPAFAAKAAKPLSTTGTLVLVVAIVPVLASTWRSILAAAGDYSILAIVLFTLVSLLVGHVLGGPDADDRTVLALSTASRHPGVALAIAGAIGSTLPSVSASIMLAFLVASVVTGPYVKWRRRAIAPRPS